MEHTAKDNKVCAGTMKLLGDYWTLRIIDALGKKEDRFCELQRTIGNCNPVTLTDRLKKLEEASLVNRDQDLADKNSVTYSLTGAGREALPVIEALNRFAAKTSAA